MARKGQQQPPSMSPLARRLRAINDNGTSYREMERMALAQGVRYGSSSFEQVAKDQRAGRLDADALKAIAIVTGLSIREVADLDDERWGIQRSYVAHADAEVGPDLADVSTDRLLEEIARRAGGQRSRG